MTKKLITYSALIVTGALAGIIMMSSGENTSRKQVTAPVSAPDKNPFSLSQDSDRSHIKHLQRELQSLKKRVEDLETTISETVAVADLEVADEALHGEAKAETGGTSEPARHVLSVDNLVKAGLDEALASDILRRKNQLELAKLELRDRASREAFLGTQRYNSELSALSAGDVSLRDELGDEAYDRYLFASGQSNRVRVQSVMMGSAAEQAGIKAGDLITSYNARTVFTWAEIQQATAGGELGEYVSLGILRDGISLTLWVPRGPLGVRLEATSLNPGS